MAQLNLSKERLDASINLIRKSANEGVLSSFEGISHVLHEEHEGNEVAAQAYEACRNFQEIYNVYVPSVREILEAFRSVKEIAEYLDKEINIGEVAKRDTSFKVDPIDAAAARL